MQIMRGLNIPLKNTSQRLNRGPGLKNFGINCHKTPNTENIYGKSS
jgi:hypothetical protein